jgi:uncharacterized protein (TIGR00730 family)
MTRRAGIQSLCVFCGSRAGADPAYAAAARELGHALAAAGIRLVYGGGNVGLMGVIADAVLAGGGQVTGVIPSALVSRELAHAGVADMRITDSMHARKALMAELSDGFIALPGGLGTLEELCEVLTWAQLDFHHKPIALLNTQGYFDPLIQMLDKSVAEDFMRPANRGLLHVAASPRDLARFWQTAESADLDELDAQRLRSQT